MEDQEPTKNNTTSPEPLPLSFPAILINPKLKHLSSQLPKNLHQHRPKKSADSPGTDQTRPIGKRRLKRVANAQFSSNPHVSRPTTRDYQLWTADPQAKFPTPPPRGYPSSLYVPPSEPIPIDPFSATMGAFNRSLKGVRKNIRRLVGPDPSPGACPGPVEEILLKIDQRLSAWVDSKTVWKATETDYSRTMVEPNPWPQPAPLRHHPLPEPSAEPSIVEISRSPHMLNWEVPNPFGRYLVHCVARYYGIVSFSRPLPSPSNPTPSHSQRTVVCMVKAHFPTRRGSRIDGNQSLDTPPTTDLDSELSAVEVLSEDSGAVTDDEPARSSSPSSSPVDNPILPSTTPKPVILAHSEDASDPSKDIELVDPEAADHSSLDSFGDHLEDDDDRRSLSTPEENPQLVCSTINHHLDPLLHDDDDQDPNRTLTHLSFSSGFSNTSPAHLPPLHSSAPSLAKPQGKSVSTHLPQISFLDWVRS
ncbi:uncharacterized protein PGTG_02999 [Puccinia graminis f. sp. tritici CRL 75-36-700-3]|uniref:R3H-associated N-terminal domain-containing protein n=1 Tax=Puccinia graminis f. sp. tritici (strain CRL 75-36-700-3 / race SCCL) TaxID=418459 RepID=E3JYB8_PUCGT|nr:uncharacterized protein PGTG_02999 [Puccinia graminis f. sp. tritici CRL 75-36-700-3]EFP77043.1 hypothetical protein PGTG_02999 [Puccinia graminis f. sp. tritici CRL 75-36-700-3]